MGRSSRCLVLLPVAFLAWFAPSASAEPVVGLNAVGYAYTEAEGIPTKSDTAYPVCHSETEDNINRNFEGEPFGSCPDDFFLIHYTGFIQIPEHQTIEFWLAADDGGTVKIGVHEFGDWNPKGCSATETGPLAIEAGTQPLDGWFYEWGGGTCYMLAWNIDGAGWEMVPPEAFTNEPLSTTTTTTTTILLEPSSTTTTTSSTLPPASTSTTLQQPSTTSTVTPQYTTTTFIEPAIDTTSTTLQIEETVDTELPITTDPPATTEPATSPTSTETYVQDTSNIDITVDTEVPAPAPPDTILEAPTGNEEAVLEAILAFEAVMDVLDDPNATDEQIVDAIEMLLDKEVTTDQAVDVITDPEVLAAVPVEVAQAIFEAIVPSELSDQQVLDITEAVQDASEEVREAFEETIDIFGEGFDTYEPRGSTISVAQRRAVVAVTAVLLAVPAPVPQRRRF
jgi:hypothetical protein